MLQEKNMRKKTDLVQTPGRLGSAHPMPQLMMPARNHLLSSSYYHHHYHHIIIIITCYPPCCEQPGGPQSRPKHCVLMSFVILYSLYYCTWQESLPPSSLPAHIKMSGITWRKMDVVIFFKKNTVFTEMFLLKRFLFLPHAFLPPKTCFYIFHLIR